eukprot:TRINITY_DN15904_c0_g1_i3.p1 TRINITY_DN15904_c0_g1~~TRINITY_DN15904_c0_g1_i3.p1  ORF type:complete len:330 (-),score=26.65 TRINITY_DN15904_c0_g1_i3:148-1137(-)
MGKTHSFSVEKVDVSKRKWENLNFHVQDNFFQHVYQLKVLKAANNLINSIPDEICKQVANNSDLIRSLTYLDLSSNRLISLPVEICYCVNLRTLLLSHNNLISIPHQITDLYRLETLLLDHNSLSALPWKWNKLKSLRCLTLNNNVLEYIPSPLGKLVNLKKLELLPNLLPHLYTELVTNLPALLSFIKSQSEASIPEAILEVREFSRRKKMEILLTTGVSMDEICKVKELRSTLYHPIARTHLFDYSFNKGEMYGLMLRFLDAYFIFRSMYPANKEVTCCSLSAQVTAIYRSKFAYRCPSLCSIHIINSHTLFDTFPSSSKKFNWVRL